MYLMEKHSPGSLSPMIGRRCEIHQGALCKKPWLYFLFAFVLIEQPANGTPLSLQEVAEGIHVYVGPHEEANAQNLGALGNAGVVIGDRSVAVIDTGGSVAFGERLWESIRGLTDLPITHVINTHVHPDHILGNAAFDNRTVTFVGHHRLSSALALRATFYLTAFKRQLGEVFRHTRAVVPDLTVVNEMRIDLGNRLLVLNAYPTAHTNTDLTVLDKRTGTLFTGDLLFVDRLPVIDGSLKGWLKRIKQLRRIPAKYAIPGHGPARVPWPSALDAQERYLRRLIRDIRHEITIGSDIKTAIRRAALEERDQWLEFARTHPRNVTTSFAELEWE